MREETERVGERKKLGLLQSESLEFSTNQYLGYIVIIGSSRASPRLSHY